MTVLRDETASTTTVSGGPSGSYWLQTTPRIRSYAPWVTKTEYDAVVVGAGIAGVTTALLLQRAGLSVLLIEAAAVGSGVSGATTAKLSALQGLVYSELEDRHGQAMSRAYAEVNAGALRWVEELVAAEAVACDWEQRPAVTYVTDPERVSALEREREAALRAGLPVVADAEPSYGAVAAVRLDAQAQFHPRRYLLGLTERFVAAGGSVVEGARVSGVSTRGRTTEVQAEGISYSAGDVVLATHYPLLDRGLFFPRLSVERSYIVAMPLQPGAESPHGMFYAAEQPTRSVRTAQLDDGGTLVLVGGEGHHTGRVRTSRERFDRLEAWARQHHDLGPVQARWSAQDVMGPDGLPYAGSVPFTDGRVWTATGFRKWGFTLGTAAAHVIAAAVLGEPRHAWADAFSTPQREVRRGAADIAKENATIGKHFVGDRLRTALLRRTADDLAPGEGAIVHHQGSKTAAYRAADGTLHAVSPTCTHMGCELQFNDAERSWDCPCHASRFSVDGAVLEGPATEPLRQRS